MFPLNVDFIILFLYEDRKQHTLSIEMLSERAIDRLNQKRNE